MSELSTAEKISQALAVVEPVVSFIEGPLPQPGERGPAEAFLANMPSLYGHQFPFQQVLSSLDVATSAIQADPSFGGGYAFVASALYHIGFEDTDIFAEEALATALPWALRGITVDPSCRDVWEVLIEIHCYRGDFAAAERALGEVFKHWGDGDVYARTAFLFFRLQGEAEQAMNWGALAWQQEWNSDRLIQTLFALGQLYRDNNRLRQAADTYRVLCEHDHDNMWAHHFWARCEFTLGNLRDAHELNLKAIKLGGGYGLREFHEEIKRAVGRVKMGLSATAAVENPTRKITTKPVPKDQIVAAPPPLGGQVVAAPPPATKVVAAPPPVAGKVVAAPPVKGKPTNVVPAPPPKPSKTVAPPPALGAKQKKPTHQQATFKQSLKKRTNDSEDA